MARKKSKTSKYPFAGLGLAQDEEEKLKILLKIREQSAKALTRYLIRKFIAENEGLITTYLAPQKSKK